MKPSVTVTVTVTVTVAAVRGSVPGRLGAKLVVAETGLVGGTVGGGKVEAKVVAHAQAMLHEGGPGVELLTWNLQRDVGMTCGGEMTFLFERVSPDNAWHLVLFGAGHVAAALVPILATLRCQVDVVDPRGEWIGRIGDFPNVRKHQPDRYEDMVELVGAKSFVLSITQGHSTDRPVLTEVLRRHPEIPYVGVIGSASKRAVLMRELAEDGIDEALRGKVVCPMGLKIGTNDPAEIALSIVAQLLQVRG